MISRIIKHYEIEVIGKEFTITGISNYERPIEDGVLTIYNNSDSQESVNIPVINFLYFKAKPIFKVNASYKPNDIEEIYSNLFK